MDVKQNDLTITVLFKRKKLLQIISSIPLIVCIIAVVLVKKGFLGQIDKMVIDILYICAILSIVEYAVVTIVNWRCPACQSYLGRSMNISFCPGCGEQLK